MVALLGRDDFITKKMLNLEEQIINQINKAKNILIVFNSNWEGDSIASSLALYFFLKKFDKDVTIAAHDQGIDKNSELRSIWKFLPAYNNIKNSLNNLRKFIVSVNIKNATISQIKYNLDGDKLKFIIAPEKGWFKPEDVSSYSGGFSYDLIFVLDTSDLESLERIYDNNVEFFYKTPIINIDHQADNEEYGQINYLDLNVASTAELIYNLIKKHDISLLDEDIATCLLTGIISKTKNYKNPNLTPRTLLTSSKLISAGARREEIVEHLYRSRSLSSLKVWGQILTSLKSDESKQISWSVLNFNEEEPNNYELFHFDELAEEIFSSSDNSKLFLLIIKSPKNSKLKLIAYANKGYSANDALQDFDIIKSNKLEAIAEVSNITVDEIDKIINKVKLRLAKNIG